MNVSFEKWKNWDAAKCSVEQNDLIIGISAGPRILSLTHNSGKNILYEDNTNFSVGEWKMYGGHRFTIAPENEDSYFPDNYPCEVKLADTALHIFAKQRPNGLVLSLSISESPKGGFYIDHTLFNNGSVNWQGALWAITCVPRSQLLRGTCKTNEFVFWPGTDASKWKQADGKLGVEHGDFRGKVGWYSAAPELNAIGQQGEFTISSTGASAPELCVDNGSNAEIFVCADYAELETLSEKLLVVPGGSISHRQHWQFQSI
ncbi:MAG: hypothetical protein QM768_20615 [Agriterribacter sp.]